MLAKLKSGAFMKRWIGLASGALLAGCVTTPPVEALPQVQAWLAAGGPTPPPVESCPHVAEVNLWDIAFQQAEWAWRPPARDSRFLEIVTPEGVSGPSADALVILRAVEPSGGMHPNTVWSVVWKEADGVWWFWRQNRDPTYMPSPPPPPWPSAPPEEHAAHRALFANGGWNPPDHQRWPPSHGRLAAHQVEAIEAALADPCRAWEPDFWPALPRLRGQPRPPPPLPFQDSTPILVEIEEMGRPPRRIAPPREHPSHSATIRWVAYGPQREL